MALFEVMLNLTTSVPTVTMTSGKDHREMKGHLSTFSILHVHGGREMSYVVHYDEGRAPRVFASGTVQRTVEERKAWVKKLCTLLRSREGNLVFELECEDVTLAKRFRGGDEDERYNVDVSISGNGTELLSMKNVLLTVTLSDEDQDEIGDITLTKSVDLSLPTYYAT
jgi:hypothetical protein